MDKRLLELLNELVFSEHPEIPQLYQKYVDEETTTYIDFNVLEIFGDTGSGKSKFVHALALEALNSGKKVFFLDTERKLSSVDIAKLGGAYRYTPVFDEIKKITQSLSAVDLVIIDSVGLPILTKFARMSMKEKGNALLDLIALMGDLKEWAYRHNGTAVVTNQPESEFAKPEGYERKPFGDKSCFAAKETWHIETTHRDKNLTRSHVKAFRSRSMGRGSGILTAFMNGEMLQIMPELSVLNAGHGKDSLGWSHLLNCS
jgi:RecA/RadA recombinase